MTDDPLLELAFAGAEKLTAGEISWDEFTSGMAWLTLKAQGVESPTVGQVGERIQEMNTAAAFIGAIPKPE